MAGKSTTQQANVAVVAESTLQTFLTFARTIPDAEEGSGLDNIISQILSGETADDLDSAWQSTGGEKLINKPMTITEITKRPSDFGEGLGVYLVVSAILAQTGESVTFTTGSVSIVAQLAKAYAGGMLPLDCQLVQAARPSAQGYFPQHLEILRG